MSKTLNCIMLVDDDPDDNFIHERAIKKNNAENIVITKNTGTAALEYLRSTSGNNETHPDLIFLDINMPGMNGWEFLEEYSRLDAALQSRAIIIMLTTSEYGDDIARAKSWAFVSDFITKPLSTETMKQIAEKHFHDEQLPVF